MLAGCLKGVALYMKRLIAVLCAALMLLAAGAASAAVPVTTYRVGYTPTPGFFTRAQDGSCHGSGYAYLEELSLYAGCRFDYVELPLGQEFDRLRAGEVDILVGGSGTPFSDLLYSHHDIARPALELSLSDNAQRDLTDAPRIAYFAKIYTEQALRASLARFFPDGDYTLVPFQSLPAMDDAAAAGEVDAITNDAFHPHPGTQPAGRLRLLASHLTYAPGNAALCEQLDRAIDEMLTVTPNLRPLLEQQTGRDRAPLFLTPEEKAYLAAHNHFTALASPQQMPYSYFDGGRHRGIIHDVIAQIERDLGITFEVRETPTDTAMFEQLANGEADVLVEFYFDFSWARQHGVYVTNPYLSTAYVIIRRRGQSLPDAPRVAAQRSRNVTRQYIEQIYPAEQISYFDTDAQCLAAVNDGRADLALVKSTTANAQLYNGLFYRLMAETNVVFSHGTSLAVSDRLDPIFVRILNKEIAHLDPVAVQSAINEETSAASDKSPLASLLYRYPQESFLVVTALFLLLLAAVILTLYVRRSHLAAITRLAYHDSVTDLCNERWLEQVLPDAIHAEGAALKGGRLYLAGICVHQLDYLRATFALNLLAKSFADISRRAHATFPWFKNYAISTDHTRLTVLCALPERMTPEAAAAAISSHFSSVPLGDVVTRVLYHMSFLPITRQNMTNVSQLLGESIASLNYAREHNLPFVLFDQAMHDRFLWNRHLDELAPKAFARQEFAVWYQPKYDLATKKLVGAEALVRWQCPELGLLTPGRFIDYFERIGLATRLDYYILGHVARFLEDRLRRQLPVVPISVNQSALHLSEGDYLKKMKETADAYLLPRGLIDLELTETSFIDFKTKETRTNARHIIDELKAYGYTTSMDDFCTGYSSIAMLQSLPMDTMKIDRSILLAAERDPRAAAILESVIQLGRSLGMHVLTEGIETPEQEALLRRLGCTYGQGYLYAKPMPQEEFERFLETHLN